MKSQESWLLLNFSWFFIFNTLVFLSVSDKVCPPDSDEELSVTGQEVSSEITQHHLLLLSFSSSALLDQSRPSIPAGQSEGWWVMSCIGLLCGGADAAELQIFSVNREELERASLQGEWQIHSFTPHWLFLLLFFYIFCSSEQKDEAIKADFSAVTLFLCSCICSSAVSLHLFPLSRSHASSPAYFLSIFFFSFCFVRFAVWVQLLHLCRRRCAFWQQWHHRWEHAHTHTLTDARSDTHTHTKLGHCVCVCI